MSCQQHAIQKRYLSPHMANVIPRLHADLGIRLFTIFSGPRSQALPSFLLFAVFARGESLGTRLVVCDWRKGEGGGQRKEDAEIERKRDKQLVRREEKEGKEKGKRKRQRNLEEGKKQVDEEKEGKGDR